MKIEKYKEEHKERCLEIFQSNLGKYFAGSELKDYESYLERYASGASYFVLLNDEVGVACGGYEEVGEQVALCWGMVHRRYHGKNIGKYLLEHRMACIAQLYNGREVVIDTSQHTQGFYQKHGFKVTRITKNGYAEGLDKVYMVHVAGNT